MGIIGSLIIHGVFLFLSSYIYVGKIPQQEERIIEVSLVSIPPVFKKEVVFIPKKVKIKGPVIPSVRSESPPLKWKPKRDVRQPAEDETPPLRWQPKMLIPKEAGAKKEEGKAFQGPKLDIANTYGEIQVGGEGKGIEGIGTGEGGEGAPLSLEITGEVARRAIFYSEGFEVPEWLEKKGISVEGRFKFWVLPDGSVDRVVTLHSFGYRELDSLAINAILRWRFCSLKKGTYEEWGIARIKIKLK